MKRAWKPVGQKDMQRRLGGYENFCADLYEQKRIANICRGKFPADLWEDAFQRGVLVLTENHFELKARFDKEPIIDAAARGMTAAFIIRCAQTWVWWRCRRQHRETPVSACRHSLRAEKDGYFEAVAAPDQTFLAEEIDEELVEGIKRACDHLPIVHSPAQRRRARQIVDVLAQSAAAGQGIGIDEYDDLPAMKEPNKNGTPRFIHHDNKMVARVRLLHHLAESCYEGTGNAYQQTKNDIVFIRHAATYAIAERKQGVQP